MFQLGDLDGHMLALLASDVCQANAYYRCPYEGGAAFVLIQDERLPKPPEPPLARIASVFPQAISSIEIPDHRLALLGHLDHYGLAYEEEAGKVLVKEGGEAVLSATFDDQQRLTQLDVQIRAASPAHE